MKSSELKGEHGCPFRSRSGGIALADLPAILRVGDRVRLERALAQLESSVEKAEDLDEARGLGLTFIAVVTAAMLEMGGGRDLHRVQLEVSREFDRLEDHASVARMARQRVEEIVPHLFAPEEQPHKALIDRAMHVIERNYSYQITDADVATRLGLSTSHFRHLFRQATGQPFHKYLIGVRLEKAKAMLNSPDLTISQVATEVGFAGLAHFSRAFTERFSASPSTVRRQMR